LGLEREDFVAVGDGINDYPMFEYAGLSLGVNVKDESKVDLNFDKVDSAIEYLLK
jgi:phosphoserine phosphatase